MKHVLVRKINSGLSVELVNKSGEVSKRRGLAVREAISTALDRYFTEVDAACRKHDFDNYNLQYRFRYCLDSNDPNSPVQTVRLEPWGFALGDTLEEARMNNSGSTPTTGRAKTLWIFQEPLTHHESNGLHSWEKIYEV